MMHWFSWGTESSLENGLWIGKLPKIIRAPERYSEVKIPGRAGELILLEGEDVYDSYVRECTVITPNTNPKIQHILEWLRGSSDLVFSNEIEMAYVARIVNEVAFERIGNCLLQARIQFYCEPLKKAAFSDTYNIALMASSSAGVTESIVNPGDVMSKPVVEITATGNRVITFGSMSMSFENLTGTVVVDCDAGIITKDGALWTEKVTGDFWRIPKGNSSVSLPASTSVEIRPNWRWV